MTATVTPRPDTADAWSARAWRRTAPTRAEVDRCAFVVGLRDGTLPGDAFTWFLGQDALYLIGFSRALALASAAAPTVAEQIFWARSAATSLEEEAELHRSRLGGAVVDPSDTTLHYVNHMLAARGSYAELVAAVLPCFWLYTDLGERLIAVDRDDHPYHDWLQTYGDPAFAEDTRRAVEIADAAALAASGAERDRMDTAFDRSMRHELAFFQAPVAATR